MAFDPTTVLRDPARLAVLRATGLFESPPDEALHRYTRLITRLLEAPLAILSLVDDRREHVLSAIGLADALASPREIPLTDSIARLVIGGRAPLTAADVREDHLLATIPMLARLGIVAYAGVPLMVQGQPLGVLAVGHSHRRDWAMHDLAALADLGAAAGAEIELRLSVRSLQAREERVDDLLAYAGDMILTLAPSGRILRANAVLESALGYAPGALEERWGIELVAPEDREAYLHAAGRIMVEGAIADFEAHLLTRTGERRLVRGGASCRYGERVPLAVRLIFRDVTAERDAQEQLALLERVTHGLAAAADLPAAMHVALAEMCRFAGWPYGEAWLRTPDGGAECCQRWVSDPGLEELGPTRGPTRLPVSAGAAGGVWTSRVPTRFDLGQEGKIPRSSEAARRLRQALGKGLRGALAVPIIAGEETLGIFVFAAREGADVREERTAALATVAAQIGPVVQRRRAETERRRAEEERKRAQQLFGAVIAAATENAIIASEESVGTVLAFNAGAERMLGYSADELVGKATTLTLHDPAEIAARAAELGLEPGREVLVHEARLGRAETREWTYIRKDGTRLPVSLTITAMRNEFGEIHGFLGVATDISERRRIEEALRAARDAAESATRAKSEFLANMSHEIRTPMNAILGMTELLTEMELAPEQQSYVRLVHGAAESLLQVIDDILDFSRIEAGQLVLDPHPFRLRDAFGDTVRMLGVRAREKQLELAFRVHPDVPDALIGDLGRLRQVLINLVGNAIKFTEAGEVVVEVSAQAEAGDDVRLHLEVRDTGIGIIPDRQRAIFEPFTQADPSTTRRFGGSGLGLTISRKILSLMGGNIAVESEPGRGSTFGVSVPLRRDPAAVLEPPDPATAALLRDVRVLIVDDNATSRLLLAEGVGRWQMRATTLAEAEAALAELLAAARAGDPFRLVLVDAVLSGTDGFELAAAIRAQQPAETTIVMMLPSAAAAADVARCRELRIARYLAKPIKEGELVRVIAEVLGGGGAGEGPPKRQRSADGATAGARREASLRVLLAEDNLVNQKVARAMLEKQGHAVVVASNGRDVVDLVRRGGFDVVLMDAQMPELSGLEATALIRQHERTAGGHLPIIAVTAHALKGDRERCLAAGMDGYVTKPLRARDLLEELARVVPTAGPLPA